MIPVVVGSSPIGHPKSSAQFFAALVFVIASACARTETLLEPDYASFSVCFGHGCATVAKASLTPSRGHNLRQLFSAVTDAQTERERIAQAIGVLEKWVGEQIGTAPDRGGTGLASPGQMDCIDESVNSTTYLKMLDREGLLRWHVVEDRATRGWLILGWPHTTAVIRELETGQRFAVDSWFFDNGIPPAIVALEEWRKGWTPNTERVERRK